MWWNRSIHGTTWTLLNASTGRSWSRPMVLPRSGQSRASWTPVDGGHLAAGEHNRVRWICVLPLLSMPDALDLLPWCKANGAVGVFMRPIEGERLLHDPYFDRLYEAVSRLNLCLGVHVSNANPRDRDLLGQRVAWGGGFWPFLTPVVGACHAAITSGLMQRHPGLRLGFIEASGSWL